MPAWQRHAAVGSHVLLYALMFAVPLVGWAMLSQWAAEHDGVARRRTIFPQKYMAHYPGKATQRQKGGYPGGNAALP
jgi:hypothetical protein